MTEHVYRLVEVFDPPPVITTAVASSTGPWIAHDETRPGVWEAGATEAEAIGELVISLTAPHPHDPT